MITKIVKRCPHCNKQLDVKVIDIDNASMDEVTALLKAVMRT